MTTKIPSPQERPDLYDDFDGTDRAVGAPTGVKTPDYIQKLIDARKPATPANNTDEK